jgi:hypothetical protein
VGTQGRYTGRESMKTPGVDRWASSKATDVGKRFVYGFAKNPGTEGLLATHPLRAQQRPVAIR